MSTKSRWFVAEAVFKATLQSQDADWKPLIEELLFLVFEIDEISASAKAEAIAREKEHSYQNQKGQRVTWRFVRLIEVKEMIDQRFEDGAEIKSTMRGGGVDQDLLTEPALRVG
ncbi:MAG: DUF4288 domain-containing protein [Bryobacteraceae bacterium]